MKNKNKILILICITFILLNISAYASELPLLNSWSGKQGFYNSPNENLLGGISSNEAGVSFALFYDNDGIVDISKVTFTYLHSGHLKLYDENLNEVYYYRLPFTSTSQSMEIPINLKDIRAFKFYSDYSSTTQDNRLAIASCRFYALQEPLTFIEKIEDLANNLFTYVFNKNVTTDKSKISVKNDLGEQIDFNYVVENNLLKISPVGLIGGRYNINVLEVKSIDNSEVLTNLPTINFAIKGFELLNKNFGDYITLQIKEFKLTFTKDISDANIYMTDSENNIVSSTFIKSGANLILNLNDTLLENKEYKIVIDKLISVDGLSIDSNLIYSVKTIKTLGNVGIDTIMASFLSIFTESKNRGILIVILAIGIGVIFIIAKWLWNKLKLWLRKV